MAHPLRIQRKRTKGYRLPDGAVYVGRPTKWGNPFDTAFAFRFAIECVIDGSFNFPRQHHSRIARIVREIRELQGKQIACWCALDKECHADILAEIANKE